MRITKKEAERIFNNGGTVYGYSKLATNEFDYLDNSFYMLKPMPMRKYAPDVTWKDQLALAKMRGQADWFATH